VKRAVAWIAGLVGIAALGRVLSRRGRVSVSDPTPLAADPAAELRSKLAAHRTEEHPAEAQSAEAPPHTQAPPAPATATLEERRDRIHAKAQEAIDAMRESDG
jgi:hypothetical protein